MKPKGEEESVDVSDTRERGEEMLPVGALRTELGMLLGLSFYNSQELARTRAVIEYGETPPWELERSFAGCTCG